MPEKAALHASRDSAERELAALKDQERMLSQVLLAEEGRLEGLKQEEQALAAAEDELNRQQVAGCLSAGLAEWADLLQACSGAAARTLA